MSIQKLRTPKGLAYLSSVTKSQEKNVTLFKLQELQNMFCALWSECIWQIADASASQTKFIISDHPVTVYNKGCFPVSKECEGFNDPGIWLTGTHTYFPLSEEKILILTNLSWVRYPYGNPIKERPNPNLFRETFFDFRRIQTHRTLSEEEVLQINYITKSRAYKYVAARKKEWLYPESQLKNSRWDIFGENYLLMPDPRSVTFSSEVIIGYQNNRADIFDEYGRRPAERSFSNKEQSKKEWETFLAFQGEYARKFGPRRRGRCFDMRESLSNEEDKPDYHAHHVSLESKHKKYRYRK